MEIPPWFGEPTGFDHPDPLIYWFATPLLAYPWAILIAAQISAAMEIRRRYLRALDDEDDDEDA